MTQQQNNIGFDSGVHPFDGAIERSLLAGIKKFNEIIFEVDEILSPSDFHFSIHACIYDIFKKIIIDSGKNIDNVMFSSKIKEFGIDKSYGARVKEIIEIYSSIDNSDIFKENIIDIAIKIKKFAFTRTLRLAAVQSDTDLSKVTGKESIDEIISMAENRIFNVSTNLSKRQTDTIILGQDFFNIVTKRAEHPIDFIGIPSGFPIWDSVIGGLRRQTTTLVGARPKRGKSSMAINIAKLLGIDKKVPVLYLDTEMVDTIQNIRLGACITGVPITELETGRWKFNEDNAKKIFFFKEAMLSSTISYRNISGMNVIDYIPIMRRWLVKNVGRDEEGKTKDCLIIVDWLKIIDSDLSKGIQEFQILGFILSKLHDFAVLYDVPILVLVQLNRDGLTRETEDVLSGSDRLAFFCDSLTILSNKIPEEIRQVGIDNGNKKLVPVLLRHGQALDDNDYINIVSDLSKCQIQEGKLYSSIIRPQARQRE